MGHTLTRADAIRGAQRTNAVLAERRKAERAESLAVYELADRLGREGITAQSVEATLQLGQLIARHRVDAPESAAELKEIAQAYKIAHTIMRLEHNESTSNAAVSSLTAEQRAARMAELRARMAEMVDPPDPPTADTSPHTAG